MNLKRVRKIKDIEKNLDKLRFRIEYLIGDYFTVREKQFATTVRRVNVDTYLFRHYRKRFEDEYEKY